MRMPWLVRFLAKPDLHPIWLARFLAEPDLHPNGTGHGPHPAGPPHFGGRHLPRTPHPTPDELGLGWLYHGLVRLCKPQCVVCIGSGRGFAPMLMAKGLKDLGSGVLHFIDPSFDDDFWMDPRRTRAWFSRFGVQNVITHHLMTAEEFTRTDAFERLPPVNLLNINGGHVYEAVKADFESFIPKLAPRGIVLFHDTMSRSRNPLWWGPRRLLLELEQAPSFHQSFQVFDFPFGAGLTILQHRDPATTDSCLDELSLAWKGGESEF